MSASESEATNRAGADFLRIEIDLGMTFAGIALDAGADLEKVRRNTENARKAYDAVLRFMPRCAFTDEEAAEMEGSMANLKASLLSLGEAL